MVLGLRERQKAERRRRIEAAAREVFREKGYEAATTREIAERAEVSIGTLFAYAADKRELLVMVYRDELHELTEATFETVPLDAPLLEQLMHVLTPRYAYWNADPKLARHAVRETFASNYSPTEGPPGGERTSPEQLLRQRLVQLIAAGQRDGHVLASEDPELIARVVLDIYLSENRSWLAEAEPLLAIGVARLRDALELALRALAVHYENSRSKRIPKPRRRGSS
jgi:AcrR family transcriptional regulator